MSRPFQQNEYVKLAHSPHKIFSVVSQRGCQVTLKPETDDFPVDLNPPNEIIDISLLERL